TSREVSYLEGAQNADGGFGGAKGQRSSELFSAWAAIGLAATGRDPLTLRRGGHTVLSSIEGEASTLQGAGDLERTILALRACGVSTHRLPGGDPVARLLRFRSPDGSFGRLVNITAFAILALRASGESASDHIVRGAARWLAHQQNHDGGFGYAARGTSSDIDDTGAALQGVVSASVPDGPVVSQAVAFLTRTQNRDGGYPQERGGESNAQSTAWAVQGLLAAGARPAALKRHGHSPLDYLEGLVASDGSVRYSSSSSQTPVWVTAEALAALAGKPLPVASVGYSSPASSTKAASASTSNSITDPAQRLVAGKRSGPRGRGVRPAAAQARLNLLAREAGLALAVVLAPVVR
ncbi:MAG: prenyltransferase/squalene oxidase repeat-containing protein, partial [Solirubrobacteraceae bacterium]